MSYKNSALQGRLVLLSRFSDAFSELYISDPPKGSCATEIVGANPSLVLHQIKEFAVSDVERDLFHFPFLFHANGHPWHEANAYLLDHLRDKPFSSRPTDDIRRRASKLLDYLMFCERFGLDWLDFSAKRATNRPTYRYFEWLQRESARSALVINQYTGVVFAFYKYVSSNWHSIDIGRVDSTREVGVLLQDELKGSRIIKVEKRGQTLSAFRGGCGEIGYVKDEGEDLRPLTNLELGTLVREISGDAWSPLERLLVRVSLFTGARKQTALTIRMRHLEAFRGNNIRGDGTYLVHAGPGTGIDTKRNKSQKLYFPRQLAEDILIYADSDTARKRREKFQRNYAQSFPHLPKINDGDIYVFLSDQGDCYYTAKSDPRYPFLKSRRIGQVVDTLSRKIKKACGGGISSSFKYHWLRATFAFQIYQRLSEYVVNGVLTEAEVISFIQTRMHHAERQTTESYLKLFKMHSDKLSAQEAYESGLFGFQTLEDLKLDMQLGH